jgi:phosphatidylglycerophosphate synthase
VISARTLGKAKTAATNAGIAILLLAADAASGGPMAAFGTGVPLLIVGLWVLVIATALAVVSGAAYVSAAWPILVGSRRPD